MPPWIVDRVARVAWPYPIVGMRLTGRGFDANKVEIVRKRLAGTHWKRKLPTVALVSPTGIGESYLRPVDY